MPRHYRPHLPGHAFHIVSRTQGGADWFTDDIKSRIASLIVEGVASGGAQLFSHAVMSNHLHVVLVQGPAPLGWTMQPVLRRIALLVQKKYKLKGHVFGAKYFSKLCRDAEQLQSMIMYVHRNPVDAQLCVKATDYEWSSARVWAGLEPCGKIALENGLRAFTCSDTGSIEEMRAIYLDMFNRTSVRVDSLNPELRTPLLLPDASFVRPGDTHLRDLHDAAKTVLRAIDSSMCLEVVRSRYGGPIVAAVRRRSVIAKRSKSEQYIRVRRRAYRQSA